MTTQHIETLIIGAGQAGLSTGYHLKQRGRGFLIVDSGERIGDNWRCHYDSLRLFTPAYADSLDGLPFPSDDPWSFPTRDEFAAYLELYARTFELPVRLQTRVNRLSAGQEGGYLAFLDSAELSCDNVVIATGSFGRTPWPREYRGVVDSVPGLYFCGLSFQYAFASMEMTGVGRDAAYVAKKIADRQADRVLAAA